MAARKPSPARRGLERRQQGVEIGQQDIAGLCQLTAKQVSKTSEEVIPWCTKRASPTFGEIGENAITSPPAMASMRATSGAALPQRRGWNNAQFGLRVTGVCLDLKQILNLFSGVRSPPFPGASSEGSWPKTPSSRGQHHINMGLHRQGVSAKLGSGGRPSISAARLSNCRRTPSARGSVISGRLGATGRRFPTG